MASHSHAFAAKSSSHRAGIETAIENFISVYNARATYFSASFIKKVEDRNRKALSELQRFPMPPTRMDLRAELAQCVAAHVPDDHIFAFADGRRIPFVDLKRFVPEWSSLAETVLMESDPALADKLMSPAQWNAKSAFEVAFASAMNELKEIKKTKLVSGSIGHYTKWIIAPLMKSIEQIKELKTPGNSLIGYGERIPLSEAVKIAEGLPQEFQKLFPK